MLTMRRNAQVVKLITSFLDSFSNENGLLDTQSDTNIGLVILPFLKQNRWQYGQISVFSYVFLFFVYFSIATFYGVFNIKRQNSCRSSLKST